MIGIVTQTAIDEQNARAVKAAVPPGRTFHANLQGDLSPDRLAALRQTGEGAPAGSAYHEHARAEAAVQRLDFAGASGEGNLGQLGPRRPSGDPARTAGQPSRTAPTGVGAEFRVNAERAGYVPMMHGVVPHGGAAAADIRAALVPAEAMRRLGGVR